MNPSYDVLTVSGRTVQQLLPEAALVLAAVLLMLGGAFMKGAALCRPLALLALALAALFLAGQPAAADPTAQFARESWRVGPVFVGDYSLLLRWVALVLGGFYVLMVPPGAGGLLAAEYFGTLLLVVSGTMLVCSAGDLVFLFLGLELISIPTYVILYLARTGESAPVVDDGGGVPVDSWYMPGGSDERPGSPGPVKAARWAEEATVKYFFLSLLSSSLLLYGFSFLYGAAGSMDLPTIGETLVAQVRSAGGLASSPMLTRLVPLGFLLIVTGLAFKLAAVPFHFYAPDVYQGTSHASAGLLAVAPKLAGLVVLIRITAVIRPATGDFAWQVLAVMAIVSMTWGNVMALWQREIRRMLAYSSIAHAGYLLIGLAVACGPVVEAGGGPIDGFSAAIFYMIAYSLATLGAFAALVHLSGRDGDVRLVEQLAGVAKSAPAVALSFAVFMLSLTGIPPLAGFWGKLGLLSGAVAVASSEVEPSGARWFLVLAIAGAVNAAIGAGYYLRLAGVMFFRPTAVCEAGQRHVPQGGHRAQAGRSTAWVATVAAGFLVLSIGVVPAPFLQAAVRAGQAVSRAPRERPADIVTAGMPIDAVDGRARQP
jgi:NADH-quinone oxidoreductase subunit N